MTTRDNGSELFLQVVDVKPAFGKSRVVHQLQMQLDIGLDARDDNLLERVAHADERNVAVAAIRDQFADERVIVGEARNTPYTDVNPPECPARREHETISPAPAKARSLPTGLRR